MALLLKQMYRFMLTAKSDRQPSLLQVEMLHSHRMLDALYPWNLTDEIIVALMDSILSILIPP